VRAHGAVDERRDPQASQVAGVVHADARALAQVDVGRRDAPGDVEEGDKPAVAFRVKLLGEEQRPRDSYTGLFQHLAPHRFLGRLAVLDRAPEARPAPGVGNSRLVVTMVQQQLPVVGDDEQHRRALAARFRCGWHGPTLGRARAYHGPVVQHRGAVNNGQPKNSRVPSAAAERILKAAMREFAKHGYAGARVERILKRANVSPRSLYYHFGSKRGLYDAVRERLRAQHFEDFVIGVTDEPLVDRLLANIDVAMTPRWQQWSRMLMWEALDGADDSGPYPEGMVPGDLLAFRAAQERGEVDEEFDAQLLTLAFIAITFWPVMFPRSTARLTGGMSSEQLLAERKRLIRVLVNHLGSEVGVPADEQLTDV
jgi:TetR/AcrR family transcriptional regulator